MTDVILDGVIDGENPGDWQYSAIGVNVDDIEEIKNRKVGQINQGKYTKSRNGCIIAGAYKDICYLWDKECTEVEMLEFIDYSVTQGYKVGQGRRAWKAMKCVMDYRNTKYKDKLTSYVQIRRDDADFQKILDKGQILGLTYKGNTAYNNDYRADCELNGNQFGKRTYGHRPSLMKKNGLIYIEDNYAGNAWNEYKVDQFNALIQNSVINPNFYLFIKQVSNKDEISRLNKMATNCQLIIDNANSLKALSNDPIFQNEMTSIINEIIDKQVGIKQKLLLLK